MIGWNMPPGVNETDIPGNRPEDIAAEAVIDEIDSILCKAMADGILTRRAVVEELRQMVEDYGIGL